MTPVLHRDTLHGLLLVEHITLLLGPGALEAPSSVAPLASRGTGWNAGAIAESSACQATGQMGLLPSSHTWLPFLPHLPASCPLLVPGRAAAQPPLGGPLLTSLTTLCHLCFLTQVPSPFLSFQHVVFCHCCWFLVFCFTFSLCESSETRTCGKGKGYVCSCRELKAETYFSARQKRLTL